MLYLNIGKIYLFLEVVVRECSMISWIKRLLKLKIKIEKYK